MKTPQEIKAEELIGKMLGCSPTRQDGVSMIDTIQAKLCAKIAVDEILYALQVPPIENKGHALYDSQISYWQQVRLELDKLKNQNHE